MFPIASQFLFEASNSRFCARISDNDSNKNNSKRSQFEIENILKNSFCDKSVTAGGNIEKNIKSGQFTFDKISIDDHLPKKFSVSVHGDGFLTPQDAGAKHKFWIKNIRIADDIPGANVLLHLTDDKIEVKTIKTIGTGDDLLLWFSEEILSVIGIPFLTPANIQGKQRHEKPKTNETR